MIKLLKQICCLLIVFLLSALSFAQGVQENFTFEMNNVFSEASIFPGECVGLSPSIANIRNISGYVCFKLDQPFIEEENIPLYVFEINEPWQLLKDYILDDRYISIYTYPTPHPPGQSTIPLFSTIQMSPIPIPLYSQLEDISFTITINAECKNKESIIF